MVSSFWHEEVRCYPSAISVSSAMGCIFGLAIGDALGMPFVGMTREQIREAGGANQFMPARGIAPTLIPLTAVGDVEQEDALAAGQWTDDTQLALALADTLIEERGLLVQDAWAYKIVRWLNEAPRAPGLSLVHAAIQLRTAGAEWDEAADPDGAGCGAATRVAPIALVFAGDGPEETQARQRAAMLQAMVTHGHPDAQGAAVAVAEAVAYALCSREQPGFAWTGQGMLEHTIDALRKSEHSYPDVVRCLELALQLLADGIDTAVAVRVLGVSAWALEAVPSALFLAARFGKDFATLLSAAAGETGDATESIAAIAGAVGGVLCGVEAIPGEWRRRVEDPARLAATGLQLAATSARSKRSRIAS